MSKELDAVFKATNHKLVTLGLFYEFSGADKSRVLYTIDSRDKDLTNDPRYNKVIKSIKRLYLETEDVSEYKFSNLYFYDYKHWKTITETKWFSDTLESLREELALKLKSKAVEKMLALVDSGDAGHQTLAYLANQGYVPKERVGRPNKKQEQKLVDKQVAKKAKERAELEELIKHNPKLESLTSKR